MFGFGSSWKEDAGLANAAFDPNRDAGLANIAMPGSYRPQGAAPAARSLLTLDPFPQSLVESRASLKCSYCGSFRDTKIEHCKNCGAPRTEEPAIADPKPFGAIPSFGAMSSSNLMLLAALTTAFYVSRR